MLGFFYIVANDCGMASMDLDALTFPPVNLQKEFQYE